MSLKARITDDMKAAMRAKDAQRLSAIRLLLAAIKQREVDERKDMSDADVMSVIEKMIKQRRDSIEQFELSVLQAYMPQALSEGEVVAAVAAAIQSSGAKGMADMGKVMAVLKPQLAGRADMGKVSALVKAKLSAS